MTWFANYIFAEPNSAVIASLCASPEMAQGLYLVKDLADFQWFDPQVRHGLPAEGLLVGREVCDLGSPAARWHADKAISWHALVGPATVPVLQPEVVLSSLALADLDHAFLQDVFPPIEFLRYLRWLNLTSGSLVSYYACATWGGEVEVEFAWLFAGTDRLYIFRDHETVLVYGAKHPIEVVPGTVLNLVLRHYGIDLPSQYFALCTRAFEWNRYRIRC